MQPLISSRRHSALHFCFASSSLTTFVRTLSAQADQKPVSQKKFVPSKTNKRLLDQISRSRQKILQLREEKRFPDCLINENIELNKVWQELDRQMQNFQPEYDYDLKISQLFKNYNKLSGEATQASWRVGKINSLAERLRRAHDNLLGLDDDKLEGFVIENTVEENELQIKEEIIPGLYLAVTQDQELIQVNASLRECQQKWHSEGSAFKMSEQIEDRVDQLVERYELLAELVDTLYNARHNRYLDEFPEDHQSRIGKNQEIFEISKGFVTGYANSFDSEIKSFLDQVYMLDAGDDLSRFLAARSATIEHSTRNYAKYIGALAGGLALMLFVVKKLHNHVQSTGYNQKDFSRFFPNRDEDNDW